MGMPGGVKSGSGDSVKSMAFISLERVTVMPEMRGVWMGLFAVQSPSAVGSRYAIIWIKTPLELKGSEDEQWQCPYLQLQDRAWLLLYHKWYSR